MIENFFTDSTLLIAAGICLTFLVLMGGIGYSRYKDMKEEIALKQSETALRKNEKEAEFYRRLYERVIMVMEKEQLFLQPNLSLTELAQKAMTNRTHPSNAINTISHRNFNVWLSEYRVNYFIELIHQKKDAQIDQLIREAGFSSRSSFYRQFKNIKGITPKQFMTQLTDTSLQTVMADS